MNRAECIRHDLIAQIPGTDEYVIREHLLSISVTGTDEAGETVGYMSGKKITCTGINLTELVYGHLCGEGLIGSPKDVTGIGFSEDGTRADVVISGHTAVNAAGTAPDIADTQIFNLARVFGDYEGIHTYTSASHLAILARGDEILCIMEDISRHCAIDKVIGHALLSGTNLSECMIYSSGRVQYDTVSKLVHAGVPVLISKATPTYDAMSLARVNHITIIGRAWPDGYQTFT